MPGLKPLHKTGADFVEPLEWRPRREFIRLAPIDVTLFGCQKRLLIRLMHHYQVAKEPQKALQTAHILLREDSLNENAHRTAMLAYAQLGQRHSAP